MHSTWENPCDCLRRVTVRDGPEEGDHTCRTEIQLNGTHTMRGEQETTFLPLLPEYIYIGGAPHDMLHVRYYHSGVVPIALTCLIPQRR